jgi:hypothetical protein
LLFSSPTLALFIRTPPGQQFSVIYLLGSDRTLGSIPYNIKQDVIYTIYLGIENDMGSSNYYICSVKFGAQNDSLPDSTLGKASPLPVLFEFTKFIEDGDVWQTPLTFQIKNVTINNEVSKVRDIDINGVSFEVNKSSNWSDEGSGYIYNLLIELSRYNSTFNMMNFDNRFVNLRLQVSQ